MYKCVFKTLYYKNSLYFNDYFPFVTWNAGRPKVKHCSGLWIQLIFENKLKLLIIVSLTSNFVRTILITSILWNMVDNRSREMLKAQENTISGGKFLTDCRVIKIHAIYIYIILHFSNLTFMEIFIRKWKNILSKYICINNNNIIYNIIVYIYYI